MALLVGVSTGTRILVGKSVVTVRDIQDKVMCLQVGNGPDIFVTNKERVEILPQVFVFVGEGHLPNTGDRLAFEAPRSIQILRESLVDRREAHV